MSEKNIEFGDGKVKVKNQYGKESIEYYIGYNDDDVIRPLCIKLSQMIGYVKHFNNSNNNNNNNKDNKIMSFKVSDNKLLKKYTKK